MKIYLAQFNPIVGDLDGNAKKILNISLDAFNSSADLILTPELSLWGLGILVILYDLYFP